MLLRNFIQPITVTEPTGHLIRTGSRVREKTGGPVMKAVITRSDLVTCSWMVPGDPEPHVEEFPQSDLEQVEDEPYAPPRPGGLW